MFNGTSNSNMRGNVGIGAAIAYFTRLGCPVCVPLTDSQGYDLVVEFQDKLQRIQVKTVSTFRKGCFRVNLAVKGGNRSGTGKVKRFSPETADFVFVLTATGQQYLIPSLRVGGTEAVLNEKFADCLV